MKNNSSVGYADTFSDLFYNRVRVASKPLLTTWQKQLITIGTTTASYLLFYLTLPISAPSLALIAMPIFIGHILGNAVIDLAYKAKDFPRATMTLKVFFELTLLPMLYRGFKELKKELNDNAIEPRPVLAH